MTALLEQKCVPCQEGAKPLTREAAAVLGKEVRDWILKEDSLEREFRFHNFREAMNFVNDVADISEQEGHHPDISIYYNKVKLVLSTHKIGGLSQNDFILAAKIDRLV